MISLLYRRLRWVFVVAAIYCLTIFGFAFQYERMAGDFYHPYVSQELPVRMEYVRLRQLLSTAIQKTFEAHHPDRYVLLPGTDADIVDFSTDIDYIHANLHLNGFDKNSNTPFDFILPVKIAWSSPTATGEKFKPLSDAWDFAVGADANPPPIIRTWEMFGGMPISPPEFQQYQEEISSMFLQSVGSIKLPPSFHAEMRSYWQADRGYPYQMPDSFGRMLYFSTITITTLGYGDVVPMTGKARLLCGVEATLGILLLGTLVNALGSAFKSAPMTPSGAAETGGRIE